MLRSAHSAKPPDVGLSVRCTGASHHFGWVREGPGDFYVAEAAAQPVYAHSPHPPGLTGAALGSHHRGLSASGQRCVFGDFR